MSESKWEIKISFVGTEKIVIGTILRFHSPLTFEALRDKTRDTGFYTVRSRGNIGLPKTYWMLLVNINRGAEKKEYTEYKKGDVVYCPRQDALYLIYEDNPKISLPVYYMGEINDGVESFVELRNGVMAKIELTEI
jgi:hypothetical protein